MCPILENGNSELFGHWRFAILYLRAELEEGVL